MKIAIIILNYKGLKNTLECLASIRNIDKDKSELETIVVDNKSNDGSVEGLKKIKDIKLIENNENLGYSGGNNVGIKYALKNKADFILILNNDTIVDKSLLINLKLATEVGDIISPKIYFEKGYEFHKARYIKTQLGKVIWYAGGEIDWKNIVGTHTGVDEVDNGQFNKQKEINFATGACMFAKKRVFEKIGFFDEKYFLYLEDMDFSYRAKCANLKIIFEPKAIIWHKNAQSLGGSGSALQDYYFTRNRLIFAIRYAKLRTKIAIFRQIISQLASPIKKKALFDFLTFNFGKGSYQT